MTLNGVIVVTLRYFIDFGKPAFQHNRFHTQESSRSLSHLLMSFLWYYPMAMQCVVLW